MDEKDRMIVTFGEDDTQTVSDSGKISLDADIPPVEP